ncbi:MAG: response regulator transcription factor [Spirochaetia bacterium]
MRNSDKLPWPEVPGCRLKAGSCRTIREFVRATCAECPSKRRKPSRPAFHAAREIGQKFCALTSREAELCSLLALRLNTAEIATCLFLSPRTVEKHVERIFRKLEVCSRAQLRQRLGIQTPTILSVGAQPSVTHK